MKMKNIIALILGLLISTSCFAFEAFGVNSSGLNVDASNILSPTSGGTGTNALVDNAVPCSDNDGNTAWCTTLPAGLTIPGYPLIDGTNATGTWLINITGNAATVTTNANLTGAITSIGNATSIANASIANAKLTNSSVTLTAGSGISISGGSLSLGGSATISLSSATVLNTTGGSSGTMAVGTTYILNSGNAVAYTFPATCPLGSVINVINYGSTSLQITLQTGQTATHPNGSSSSGGSINITTNTAFEMTCLSNSTIWIDKMNGGIVNLL